MLIFDPLNPQHRSQAPFSLNPIRGAQIFAHRPKMQFVFKTFNRFGERIHVSERCFMI